MWLVLSILLVWFLYSSRWVSVQTSAISKVVYKLVGLLYVDDIDLVALNSGNELEVEVVTRAQLLLDRWQYALQATSAELKYSKCYWTL